MIYLHGGGQMMGTLVSREAQGHHYRMDDAADLERLSRDTYELGI